MYTPMPEPIYSGQSMYEILQCTPTNAWYVEALEECVRALRGDFTSLKRPLSGTIKGH